ncbi:hypothetical protein NOF55_13115 [Rhizobiaceae bacterium BDR2-2]|uniref:Uncharacterized protein n=1 Tax=Ectorhizobium quercum TaxID=2965071 RepID=A0AAE3MZX9_9HYPH|nr:hypothetical protein [Ectorhizobium quercum]MCX8998044.1 hypothetical protein [Ectorhizobium quercum]
MSLFGFHYRKLLRCALIACVIQPGFSTHGHAQEAGFVEPAILACEATVERHTSENYRRLATKSLELFQKIYTGEPIPLDAPFTLTGIAAEWDRTVADLSKPVVPDKGQYQAWADMIELARDQSALYRERLAAVQEQDPATLRDRFKPGKWREMPDLSPIWLRDTVCSSITF